MGCANLPRFVGGLFRGLCKPTTFYWLAVDESKEIEDWMAGADAVMALEGGTAVKAMFLNDKTLESSRPAAEQANYEDYQKVYKLVAAFT